MSKTKQSSNPFEDGDSGIVQQPVAQFDSTSRADVALLDSLKKRIRQARVRAAVSVNRELVLLYWEIGHRILTSHLR
ncbi:TPA: hypothetical protein DIT45_02280 [Candidatus Acetothermia bacterium]|nr:hypothetical protein [Candidatus Acetothermia bacterium]